MMATGKTSRYRYNVRLETILSQAPKGIITYGEGAETRW